MLSSIGEAPTRARATQCSLLLALLLALLLLTLLDVPARAAQNLDAACSLSVLVESDTGHAEVEDIRCLMFRAERWVPSAVTHWSIVTSPSTMTSELVPSIRVSLHSSFKTKVE